jgi:hypothetical protein
MGMLRESALAGGIEDLELRALADPGIDSGLPGGVAMLGLVDAVLANDENGATLARRAINEQLGPEATCEAAAVIGNFEMMNRIADGTGTPVSAQTRRYLTDELEELGLGHVAHNWGS